MMRHAFTCLTVVALIGMCFTPEADAAPYRTSASNGYHHSTIERSVHPRRRQIDGRSLWDLGKRNGRWPKL